MYVVVLGKLYEICSYKNRSRGMYKIYATVYTHACSYVMSHHVIKNCSSQLSTALPPEH